MKVWNISQSSYYRINKERVESSILLTKYTPNVMRKRYNEEELELAKRNLDKLMPVPSGREYRVRIETLKHLFQKYQHDALLEHRIPLKWTFWLYKVVKPERIHVSNWNSRCPYCDKLDKLIDKELEDGLTEEELKQKVDLESHQLLSNTQFTAYRLHQSLLSLPEKKILLLVWDYYRINPQKKDTEHSTLVINIQRNENGKVTSDALHIILDLNESKDVAVLECAWKLLQERNYLQNIRRIINWSDGGPHDFKMSSLLYLLQHQQAKNEIAIEWNYFESWHGNSVADVRGYQVKRKVTIEQRNLKRRIIEKEQICDLVNQIPHHSAIILPNIENRGFLGVTTKRGIKSCYKIVPDGKKWVEGFASSLEPIRLKRFFVDPDTTFVEVITQIDE